MNKDKYHGGVSCLGVIGIVFMVLKLIGVVEWEWWKVLSPIAANLIINIINEMTGFT